MRDTLQAVRELLVHKKFEDALASCKALFTEQGEMKSAQLFAYTGECYEGLLQGAEAFACYERAWILDPQANWLLQKVQTYSAQRKAILDSWLMDVLAVPKVTVGAAIITRDDERTIARCLRSLEGAVDECIVIDTGSTDHTAEIAKEMGAQVFHFTWIDDFSAARNFSLSKVTSDWVICIDADEYLFDEDKDHLYVAAGLFQYMTPPVIMRIIQVSTIGTRVESNYDMSRFFSMREGFCFRGRVHEQVGAYVAGRFTSVYDHPVVGVRVWHDGYEDSVMQQKGKLDRNIHLLRKALQENPGDIGTLGFLGRELYLHGDLQESVDILYGCEHLAKHYPEYLRIPEVRVFLINALMDLGRMEEAMKLGQRFISDSSDFPNAWFEYARVHDRMIRNLLGQAKHLFVTSAKVAHDYRGIVSYDQDIVRWKHQAGLADVAVMEGRVADAYQLYSDILKIVPDHEGIKSQMKMLEDEARRLLNLVHSG